MRMKEITITLRMGAYATTRFQWKDAAGQLVNGRREGSFPGMREAVYETVIIK